MKFTAARYTVSVTLLFAGTVHAEMSANIGWASDYYYRGIFQSNSSASTGVDYTADGFYVGTWVADVGDGLEVDGYAGFRGDAWGIDYGVGFTGYYYTQDFDDTYEELNFSATIGIATVDIALGQYDNFGNGVQDYTYYSLTLEKDGFYGKYAGFSRDFIGRYMQLGYSTTLQEIEFGLSLIVANSDLVGDADESLIFTIGKSFDY